MVDSREEDSKIRVTCNAENTFVSVLATCFSSTATWKWVVTMNHPL